MAPPSSQENATKREISIGRFGPSSMAGPGRGYSRLIRCLRMRSSNRQQAANSCPPGRMRNIRLSILAQFFQVKSPGCLMINGQFYWKLCTTFSQANNNNTSTTWQKEIKLKSKTNKSRATSLNGQNVLFALLAA